MAIARLTKERIARACKDVALSLGYPTLKEEQQKVMVRFVQGECVVPTGFDKSLCYTCLPGVIDALHDSTDSVAIVITPLTAIIWFLCIKRVQSACASFMGKNNA